MPTLSMAPVLFGAQELFALEDVRAVKAAFHVELFTFLVTIRDSARSKAKRGRWGEGIPLSLTNRRGNLSKTNGSPSREVKTP